MSFDEMRDEVLAAARARARALVTGDRERLTALLHPRLRWTTHRGTVLDRHGYLAANVGGDLTWLDQRLDDVDVQVVDDSVAVLTAVVVDRVSRDGREETFRLRLSQTWVRSAGGWQCLSGHVGPRPT